MEQGFERKRLGIAVIGAGRIGTHRARLSAMHPAVDYLAIADIDGGRAEALAKRVGAHRHSGSSSEVIQDPRVNAVFISSSEPTHAAPAIEALEAGKAVFIEKPIATTREDADAIIAAAEANDGLLRIGYSVRFRRNVFLGKQYIENGKLGRIVGGVARVFNSRAQAFAILDRAPHVSPVVDVLTYYIDVVGWFMGDNHPVDVYAAGSGSVLRSKTGSEGPDDITNAVVRYADGSVMSFTICYSLPAEFPTMGQGPRIEIIGTDGVLLIDEDQRQNIIYSDHGVGHAYVQGHTMKMGYLSSTTSGDWALDQMFGPIADETRAWLDHLATGTPMHLSTAEDARRSLEVTLAIEESATTGQVVAIDKVTPYSLR